MRITLSVDDDVLEKARALAGRLRVPLKTVVNEALRRGLSAVDKPAKQRPYRGTPSPMGLREGYDLDNIGELLAKAEGEDYR